MWMIYNLALLWLEEEPEERLDRLCPLCLTVCGDRKDKRRRGEDDPAKDHE